MGHKITKRKYLIEAHETVFLELGIEAYTLEQAKEIYKSMTPKQRQEAGEEIVEYSEFRFESDERLQQINMEALTKEAENRHVTTAPHLTTIRLNIVQDTALNREQWDEKYLGYDSDLKALLSDLIVSIQMPPHMYPYISIEVNTKYLINALLIIEAAYGQQKYDAIKVTEAGEHINLKELIS